MYKFYKINICKPYLSLCNILLIKYYQQWTSNYFGGITHYYNKMLCVVWMAIKGGIPTVIDKNGNLKYHDI